MDTPYCAELFIPHVGSAFVFTSAEGAEFSLTLDQVESKPALNAGPFHSFTLILSGTREAFFEQGTYPLRHPGLGQLSIFITAIGESPTHFRYQAPFSVRK